MMVVVAMAVQLGWLAGLVGSWWLRRHREQAWAAQLMGFAVVGSVGHLCGVLVAVTVLARLARALPATGGATAMATGMEAAGVVNAVGGAGVVALWLALAWAWAPPVSARSG